MSRSTDYDPYDEHYDDDFADDDGLYDSVSQQRGHAHRRVASRQQDPIVKQALDWGISGSIVAILILTALYAFSPIDAIPDLIPVAGQADDIGAILAGGGSVVFLTALRYMLRSRVGRWSCLIVIVLSAIGAFTVFWLLARLFDSLL